MGQFGARCGRVPIGRPVTTGDDGQCAWPAVAVVWAEVGAESGCSWPSARRSMTCSITRSTVSDDVRAGPVVSSAAADGSAPAGDADRGRPTVRWPMIASTSKVVRFATGFFGLVDAGAEVGAGEGAGTGC